MAYVGQGIKGGTFSVLDTSGNTYNGSNVTFDLGTQVGSPAQLLVSHDGVIQKPVTDYTIATGGTQITFTTAPASGASIFITEISGAVGAPMNRDINGDELILDADADTSITADTDDQIDIKIAGADDFQFTANTFLVQTGSKIDINGTELILDADADTSITADTDDQIDIKIANADDFTFTANSFNVLSGSEIDLADDCELRIGNSDDMRLFHNASNSIIVHDGTGDLQIRATDSGKNFIIYDHDASNEWFRIDENGNSTFNEGSADVDFRVESNGNTHAIFVNAGDDNVLFLNSAGGTANAHFGIASNKKVTASRDGGTTVEINRNTNDGNLVDLRQAGTAEGTISVSGSTVGYNTFMGSHWSQLADNSKPTILRGTVLETIADMCVWYTVKFDRNQHNDKDTEYHYEEYELPSGKKVGDTVSITHADDISYSGVIEKESNLTLPKFKISDTEESKAVYGVFHTWDDDDDGKNWQNDASIAALGTYMIRIHKDETVAIGDYIQSKGDGTGKKQADDILRASTIGKVTSTEKVITHGDGSYCVPCTLHCG